MVSQPQSTEIPGPLPAELAPSSPSPAASQHVGVCGQRKDKWASRPTPQSRARVFCHPPQSIRGMLPHFSFHPKSSPACGARRHSPEPPMLISHHFPGVGGRLPIGSARTTEGLDVGCNCPYSDATDYLPRQLHFCATVQGTWHPYFWAFPEFLQKTALPGSPLCRHQDFSPETNSPVIALPYFLGQNCVDTSTPSLGEGAK